MRSAQNVHPEFGLWSNLRREAGCTVAFIICGSIAAASGLVLQMAGHDANVSVIAAVPLNPGTTLSTIVSPASSAMSAPNSRQGTASPSNSPQTAPLNAIPRGVTASTREATTDLPQQPVAASNSPQTAPPRPLAAAIDPHEGDPASRRKLDHRPNSGCRRRPRRFQVLAADPGRTGPLLAGSADPDRVAHGLAVAEHVIERPLAGFHHDRAARITVRKSNDFARLRQLRHGRSKQECGRKGRQRAWQMHEAPHRTALRGRSRQKALVSLVALAMERFNGTPNTRFIVTGRPKL